MDPGHSVHPTTKSVNPTTMQKKDIDKMKYIINEKKKTEEEQQNLQTEII